MTRFLNNLSNIIKEKKGYYSRLLITILVFAVLIFITQSKNNQKQALELSDTGITFTPEKAETEASAFSFTYDDLTGCRLISELDPGEVIEGYENSTSLFGLWSNEAYCTYHLCASKKITEYIVAETASGDTYIFNYDSADFTEELYEALTERIQ